MRYIYSHLSKQAFSLGIEYYANTPPPLPRYIRCRPVSYSGPPKEPFHMFVAGLTTTQARFCVPPPPSFFPIQQQWLDQQESATVGTHRVYPYGIDGHRSRLHRLFRLQNEPVEKFIPTTYQCGDNLPNCCSVCALRLLAFGFLGQGPILTEHIYFALLVVFRVKTDIRPRIGECRLLKYDILGTEREGNTVDHHRTEPRCGPSPKRCAYRLGSFTAT